MAHVESFGLAVLLVALVGLLAVLSSRVSARLRVPTPAIFLLGAAAASDLWPRLGQVSLDVVEQIVTVALVVLLFDGGMRIGWRRFREAAAATVWIGVAGTLVTAAALAAAAHLLFGFGWLTALLLGTALAPTDPAVVFSVLGRREIAGRSGTLLEGESGANDPVGIALMAALLAAAGPAASMAGAVAVQFLIQMTVGAAVGMAGGFAVRSLMALPLPSEALYPLRVLAAGLAVYGAATVAHGSGFLAVFVAGIVIGDVRAPYKGEIERFHAALGSIAEIVAFVLLGLTVELRTLREAAIWLPAVALAGLLTLVVRPVLVGLLLWPVRLRLGERLFVLWTGLKGAVPILLGVFVLRSGAPDARQLYGIVFVVVAFSVLVQGGLVPYLAGRLGVPLRTVEPEPWSLGVRFRHEPQGLRRFQVAAGSLADGASLSELPLGEDAWISLVIRDGRLVPVRGETVLRVGDEVVALVDPEGVTDLPAVFRPSPPVGDSKPVGGQGGPPRRAQEVGTAHDRPGDHPEGEEEPEG